MYRRLQVYCLPDMYEVTDRSLADIQYVLNPTFTGEHSGRGRCGGMPRSKQQGSGAGSGGRAAEAAGCGAWAWL